MSKPDRLVACMWIALFGCSGSDKHPKPVHPDQGHVADAAVSGDAAGDIDAGASDAATELDAAISDAGGKASAADATVTGRPPRLNVSFETAKRLPTDDSRFLQDDVVVDQT